MQIRNRETGRFDAIPHAVRFWRMVAIDEPSKCWLWLGFKYRGYGRFNRFGSGYVFAHRYSYGFFNGEPRGHILHSCDNPACVNPHHLRTGTHKDNVQDRVTRKRSAYGEKSGNVILSLAQAREIKRLCENGARGVDLAKRFGISPATVSAIHKGRIWSQALSMATVSDASNHVDLDVLNGELSTILR